jgi:hypothetical protein
MERRKLKREKKQQAAASGSQRSLQANQQKVHKHVKKDKGAARKLRHQKAKSRAKQADGKGEAMELD